MRQAVRVTHRMKGLLIIAVLIVIAGSALLAGFGGTAIVLPFAATVGAGAVGVYLLRRRTSRSR